MSYRGAIFEEKGAIFEEYETKKTALKPRNNAICETPPKMDKYI